MRQIQALYVQTYTYIQQHGATPQLIANIKTLQDKNNRD